MIFLKIKVRCLKKKENRRLPQQLIVYYFSSLLKKYRNKTVTLPGNNDLTLPQMRSYRDKNGGKIRCATFYSLNTQEFIGYNGQHPKDICALLSARLTNNNGYLKVKLAVAIWINEKNSPHK